MNRWIGMGRLTADPNVTYTSGNEPMAVARFNLAIDRPKKDAGADFIPCVCFGKTAESAEKMLKKGTKICVEGRIQTGSYTNKDGVRVYTTEVVVEEQEFAESKNSSSNDGGYQNGGDSYSRPQASGATEGFMNIPEGIDEDLPFAQPSR